MAANGIYLRADIPCVYINVAEKKPLRLLDFFSVFRRGLSSPEGDDVMAMLDFMHQIIAQHMPIDTTTRYETTFLKIYFDFIKDLRVVTEPLDRYNALLPIPQMQLYVEDVLDMRWSFEPNNNFRVDFGFWTGTKLIAVEIDGNEPEGYARDIRRDRLPRRADVDVIHILNTEIDKHGGENLMVALLPQSIAHDWTEAPVPERPPS